jgi:hypothetical protein
VLEIDNLHRLQSVVCGLKRTEKRDWSNLGTAMRALFFLDNYRHRQYHEGILG